jgi:Tol biopolymer transport system component
MARKPLALTIICGIAALAAAAAAPASATFPGRNGLVAYGARDGVHVVRPDGTQDRIVSRVGPASETSWGANGRRIAFSHAGSIWVAELNTGRTQRVTHGRYDFDPSFSPGGGSIAYGRYGGPKPGVWVVRLSNARKRQLFGAAVSSVEWSPDGKWIAYSLAQSTGPPDDAGVHLVSPNGSRTRWIVAWPNYISGGPLAGWLSWAPDSSQLAVDTEANSGACDGCETLYTVHADGSDLEPVAREGIGAPFWSPDGKSIAFCKFGWDSNDQFFRKLQAVVEHGEHYVGPTCGESWQARP